MLLLANILYPIIALIAMLMLAHKVKEAFILFLVVEVLMLYIGYESKQYGVLVMAIIYFFANIYSYKQWSKEGGIENRD